MFISQDDISSFNDAVNKALVNVRENLKLPLSGHIVFPYMYCAKTCHHLQGDLATKYRNSGYIYAGGITLFGGPHMFLLYKNMTPSVIDALFSVQILLFFAYVFVRYSLLKKSKTINVNVRPLSIYTDGIATHAKFNVLIKGVIGFLLFFACMGGLFTYSVFMQGYYFLFLFFFGSILWLSIGVFIISLSLIKKLRLADID